MTRFITRPDAIYRTPRELKLALGAQRLIKESNFHRHTFDYNQDFLLWPPPIESVINAPESYPSIFAFSRANKLGQRKRLKELGLPVPRVLQAGDTTTRRVLRRPLRHTGGQGYNLQDDLNYDPATEYIQELFPKWREYRIITLYGVPIILLMKSHPETLGKDDPWNFHNGCTFITVNNPEHDRLRHTNFYTKIKEIPLIQHSALLGIDVMLAPKQEWVIPELNFCPGITIPGNLEKIRMASDARH